MDNNQRSDSEASINRSESSPRRFLVEISDPVEFCKKLKECSLFKAHRISSDVIGTESYRDGAIPKGNDDLREKVEPDTIVLYEMKFGEDKFGHFALGYFSEQEKEELASWIGDVVVAVEEDDDAFEGTVQTNEQGTE